MWAMQRAWSPYQRVPPKRKPLLQSVSKAGYTLATHMADLHQSAILPAEWARSIQVTLKAEGDLQFRRCKWQVKWILRRNTSLAEMSDLHGPSHCGNFNSLLHELVLSWVPKSALTWTQSWRDSSCLETQCVPDLSLSGKRHLGHGSDS